MKNIFLLLFLFVNIDAYKAAGVLPYAIDKNGVTQVLLGLSSVHNNEASDFGGLKDREDLNQSAVTAAREGCEELMFIWDNDAQFKQLVTLKNKYRHHFDITKAHSVTYENLLQAINKDSTQSVITHDYRMYLIPIEYDKELPQKLHNRRAHYNGTLSSCWQETTQLVWVDLNALVNAITTTNSILFNDKKITVYYPFACSFLAAHKLM